MAAARSSRRRHPAVIGLIALVVALVVLFLGFTKDIPFTRPFEVRAVFQSANSIRVASPVRIAGVDVGKVKAIEPRPGTDAAVVVLQIDKDGLPIHSDATAKIRPRIFLEGNFFVDLDPGSSGSPALSDGDTIKVTQTATPVQLDQVLTALQGDTRQDLKDVLHGFNTALNSKPTAAQDRSSDPAARGQTAAQSFNDAYADIPPAERSSAQVFEALLGTEPDRDVARLINGTARTAAALTRNENALKDLITNFNGTMAAFASESGNLRTSIHELAPTLQSANGALAALNAAFPPTRAFAREILPGVRETPATIDAAFPWIAQMRKLVSQPELGGVVKELSPATAELARLTDRAITLLPKTDLVSKCVSRVVIPTGNIPINDEFANGAENYKEFFWGLVGLAGEGQNFDGNGMYVRFQTGGGTQTISLGNSSTNSGEQFGHLAAAPLGNRPFDPRHRSPYRPDVPCYTQKIPDLNGPASAKTAADAAAGKRLAAPAKGTESNP
jgi:phospholipid/cholesterol/gamma-HCH transport system substrate-binding protein